MDFTGFAGDAHLTLRFPDGRVFTKDNTPDLSAASTTTVPQPGDPFVFYRHEVHVADPSDPNDRDLKEAAFVFRGPFEIQKTALTDAEGVPTGEVVETFAPTTVPAGAYEVTIDATADADRAPVELLLGNQPPRLMRSLAAAARERPVPPRMDGGRSRWRHRQRQAPPRHGPCSFRSSASRSGPRRATRRRATWRPSTSTCAGRSSRTRASRRRSRCS